MSYHDWPRGVNMCVCVLPVGFYLFYKDFIFIHLHVGVLRLCKYAQECMYRCSWRPEVGVKFYRVEL